MAGFLAGIRAACIVLCLTCRVPGAHVEVAWVYRKVFAYDGLLQIKHVDRLLTHHIDKITNLCAPGSVHVAFVVSRALIARSPSGLEGTLAETLGISRLRQYLSD
jgi:hypothetical protein